SLPRRRRTTGRFAGGRTPGAASRSRSTRASTATSGRLVVVSAERCRYPGTRCNNVESIVIDDDSIVSLATAASSGAILIRWATGARNILSRTARSPTTPSTGWTSPRDNSQSRRLIWSSAHWTMSTSTPSSARSSGPTGNDSRSRRRRNASTPSIRTYPATYSKLTCSVGWKTARQNPTPTNRWRNSTSSWSRGSKTTSASDRPAESSRELGTLQIPNTTNITPLGQLDCHGTSMTKLWSSTPVKLSNAGDIDARATSSVRDVDRPVPSVTTTNNNPTSVAPADAVATKKLLQALSIGPFLDIRRHSLESFRH